MEQIVTDFIKIILPAGFVLYAVYLIVKSFLNKEFQVNLKELKSENAKTTLPLRLQAYERMSIFLERITPNNILLRVNDPSYNVLQLQTLMINDIREEYNHNLSQQIYVSDEAWFFVTRAKEEIIALINNSAHDLKNEAPAMELAKKIFEATMETTPESSSMALKFLKDEVRKLL